MIGGQAWVSRMNLNSHRTTEPIFECIPDWVIYGIDHYKFSNKHLIFVINHIFKRLNFDKRSESVFG